MSRVCVGYEAGKPVWQDQGPGRARVAGYDNRLVNMVGGEYVKGVPAPPSLHVPTPAEAENRKRRLERTRAKRAGL